MILQRTSLGHGYGGSKKDGRPPAHGATPTLGTLVSRDGQFSCVTLERAIDDPEHPCIPAGTYTVHKAMHHPGTPGEYECPELDTSALNPPRTHVQLHIGNDASDSEGCILTASFVAEGRLSVGESKEMFARLMAYLEGVGAWTLQIIDPPQADA